jgi:hypothetical protein
VVLPTVAFQTGRVRLQPLDQAPDFVLLRGLELVDHSLVALLSVFKLGVPLLVEVLHSSLGDSVEIFHLLLVFGVNFVLSLLELKILELRKGQVAGPRFFELPVVTEFLDFIL